MSLILPRSVASQAAEDASANVNRTFGWYATLAPSPSGTAARAEVVVLPHIVAIGEEFVREALLVCSEHQLNPVSPLHTALWAVGEKDAERSWAGLRSAWNDWHGVALGSFPSNDALLGFVDARNSVIHGLGRLTRQQKRPDGGTRVRQRLRNAGIAVSGDALDIGPTQVARARQITLDLIGWLDEEIRQRGLWPP